MDGDSLLSEPWTSVTRFALLNENQKEGNIGIRGRLTKKEVTAKLGQILGRLVKMSRGSQRKSGNVKCRTMILIMKKSQTTPEEHEGNKEPQRGLTNSPHKPTRTVQAGGDPVQVNGPRWAHKDRYSCLKETS